MDQQMQQLLDRQAIEDVLVRYGRSLDWLDEAAQASCFWPDAEIDYGFFKGSGADWVPVVMDVERASLRRWHICAGITVSIDGDIANSECYGLSTATVENEQGEREDAVFGGRYLDVFARRNGEWRIARRQYIADWAQRFPSGLDSAQAEFMLNVFDVSGEGHPGYRPL